MARPKAKSRTEHPDPYLHLIEKHWRNIVTLYLKFEEKRPVMLYHVQEQKIYAYPYNQFKADLPKGSHQELEEQYQVAIDEEKILVFVSDNEKKKFVSYCLA